MSTQAAGSTVDCLICGGERAGTVIFKLKFRCSRVQQMFPDHRKALSEFYRVLRAGGYAAVSVTANPERSFYAPVRTAIARYIQRDLSVPAYRYVLGDVAYLTSVFLAAGFREIETSVEIRRFPFETFATFRPDRAWRWPHGSGIYRVACQCTEVGPPGCSACPGKGAG